MPRTPRLRLTRPELMEPGRLVFPARALAQARAAAPRKGAGRCVVSDIEATLARMQIGLDSLSDDVENYRFPGLDDPADRPWAA